MTFRPALRAAALCAIGSWLGLTPLLAVRAGAIESIRTFYGLCDASAAAALDADFFAVGDDEDNVMRVYHRHLGVLPAASLDLSGFLETDPENPETDLEGAARLGDLIYWITSHGRNRKGEECLSRQRFFAIAASVRDGTVRIEPVGRPYTRLLQDLIADPRLTRFNLAAAAALAPKAHGALNIEGLTATPAGQLLIGFRSPIPEGQALLVPLVDPAEVIAGSPARLGHPAAWRSTARHPQHDPDGGGRTIIAGSADGDGPSGPGPWEWNRRSAAAGWNGPTVGAELEAPPHLPDPIKMICSVVER